MANSITKTIHISEIVVADRIRKDNGSLGELADSIRERGLINPITVMENADGGFLLIAGLRRLKACKLLDNKEIRATVISPMEADEALMLEIAENEQRKDFTVAERLSYAERIKAVEAEKSRQRMLGGIRVDEATDPVGDCPQGSTTGRTRDIVAKKAGFSSSRQMRRAATVADKRPDLLEKIDKNETSIFGAYKEATRNTPAAHQAENSKKPLVIEERRVEVEPLLQFNPMMVEVSSGKSGLEGARHDQLMNNLVYRQLFEHYQDAVQKANLALGELRTRSEGYERRIRAYEENAEAMRREIARLKEAQNAGK